MQLSKELLLLSEDGTYCIQSRAKNDFNMLPSLAYVESKLNDETSRGAIRTIIHRRLDILLGTNLRGQTAADTAFKLSLSGCDDDVVYSTLMKITN
jgi:hypothetical protein